MTGLDRTLWAVALDVVRSELGQSTFFVGFTTPKFFVGDLDVTGEVSSLIHGGLIMLPGFDMRLQLTPSGRKRLEQIDG